MHDFEETILNDFYVAVHEDYLELLKSSRTTAIPLELVILYDQIPFSVYYTLWKKILHRINNADSPELYAKVILRNAYLQSFLADDENKDKIRSILEETDMNELINKLQYNDYEGTALIKYCISFLITKVEEPEYEEFILEEITPQDKQEAMKEKFKLIYFTTLNDLYRKIIIDYVNLLADEGYSLNEICQTLDGYFYNEILRGEIKDRYEYVFKEAENMSFVLDEQKRLIFQTVFIAIQAELYSISNFNMSAYLNQIFSQNEMPLPLEKNARWALYEVFIAFHSTFSLKGAINKLTPDERLIVKKVLPNYFLDATSSES